MPEYIKILGQVTTGAAGSVQQLSMFPDPNFEFYPAGSATHTHANEASPLFGAPFNYSHGSPNSNSHVGYSYGEHAPNSANATGRTNSLYFGNHNSNVSPAWKMSQATSTATSAIERPFLKSGQVYTMSFFAKFNDDSGHFNNHHGHGGMWYWRGSTQTTLIPWQDNHTSRATTSYGWVNNNNLVSGWKQWYGTFTGEGGYFDFQYAMWNHSFSGWGYMYIDNFLLLEGAVPRALLPTRPTDGASGNANALYTSPYTTRSEGWNGTAYRSPTIRKVTGSWQTLYTVPDNRAAVASTLHVSNFGAANATFRVAVQKAGETLSSQHIFAFDHPITQTSSESLSIGMTLAAGDKVIVQSDVDKLTFQLYGSEQTV